MLTSIDSSRGTCTSLFTASLLLMNEWQWQHMRGKKPTNQIGKKEDYKLGVVFFTKSALEKWYMHSFLSKKGRNFQAKSIIFRPLRWIIVTTKLKCKKVREIYPCLLKSLNLSNSEIAPIWLKVLQLRDLKSRRSGNLMHFRNDDSRLLRHWILQTFIREVEQALVTFVLAF